MNNLSCMEVSLVKPSARDVKENDELGVVRMRFDGSSGCQFTEVNLPGSPAGGIGAEISCFKYLHRSIRMMTVTRARVNSPVIISSRPKLHYTKMSPARRNQLNMAYQYPHHRALSK
jgi:hypothetical protein